MASLLGDLGEGLAAVAPSIASAFGGPLAGLGVTWLEKALGVAPGTSSDPSAFQTALSSAMASPDQVLALKKADNEFKEFCLKNNIEWAQLDVADRKSARDMQIATKDWMPRLLGLAIVAMAVAAAYMLFTDKIPTARDPSVSLTVGSVIGYIFNELKQVLAYYFGSSAGSAAKDATIADQARGPNGGQK